MLKMAEVHSVTAYSRADQHLIAIRLLLTTFNASKILLKLYFYAYKNDCKPNSVIILLVYNKRGDEENEAALSLAHVMSGGKCNAQCDSA